MGGKDALCLLVEQTCMSADARSAMRAEEREGRSVLHQLLCYRRRAGQGAVRDAHDPRLTRRSPGNAKLCRGWARKSARYRAAAA